MSRSPVRARLLAAATAAAAVAVLNPVGASADPAARTTGDYVVQLAEEPLASYSGGVAGIAATAPADGGRLDATTAEARRYRAHLAEARESVLAKVPGAEKIHEFDTALNGFSARMTGHQARALMADPAVRLVTKVEMYQQQTSWTPKFLGLSGKGGVWERQFGDPSHAGEGTIVGVVDGGFTPDSPSLAPLPEPRPDAEAIKAKWKGGCDPGVEAPISCNNKVIGARWFFGGGDPGEEFASPRDYSGHGTHTATTSAGNHDVDAVVGGQSLGKVSGMAPAARLAIYKACYLNGCRGDDMVKSIDQATADGVDVINFSISGPTNTSVDIVELAFLGSARAGVFVAAASGNGGPNSVTNHPSPWLTTVAASTHGRAYRATATLGDGQKVTGVGLGAAVPSAPLVVSTAVAKADAKPEEARLCYLGTLDPAKVKGKVVLCDRGVNGRTDKSKEVKAAGGVGMVLANVADKGLVADLHAVPTVHVEAPEGDKVRAYAKDEKATAALSAGEAYQTRAPEMAAFTSPGPSGAANGDVLKPDLTAPGVDVLAGVAPVTNNGEHYSYYSGTSMATPHVAGLAALLKGKHPGWSPMAVKSALMTTAYQRDTEDKPIQRGGKDATPFDFGAGHVKPGSAFDPGLVYDSTPTEWLAFLCGSGQLPRTDPACRAAGSIDPSDLNLASISVGDLYGEQTVTRRVTNVGTRSATYRPKVEAPAGVEVKVSPTVLSLYPGQTASYRVTFVRTNAAFDATAFGAITWSDGAHSVRSPIAVRPRLAQVPGAVSGSGTSGSLDISGKAGFTGTLTASTTGLTEATVTPLALRDPNGEAFPVDKPATNAHVGKVTVTVPAGSSISRLSTFTADFPQGVDVDVWAYREDAGKLTLVAYSANNGAQETVDLPGAGTFQVFVDYFAGPTELSVPTSSWVVPSTAGANLSVTPASQRVTQAKVAPLKVAWKDLAAGKRYLGTVDLTDGTAKARTVVSVTG